MEPGFYRVDLLFLYQSAGACDSCLVIVFAAAIARDSV